MKFYKKGGMEENSGQRGQLCIAELTFQHIMILAMFEIPLGMVGLAHIKKKSSPP